MKISTTVALALATWLSAASLAAYAQTEQPTVHHRYHHDPAHHAVHHHFTAHGPANASAPVADAAAVAPAPHAAPFGLALPHIAPYPDNRGDEDGLSGDQDDCNKGCVDGNTPD